MATIGYDRPHWFDNDYLEQNFDVSKALSEDEKEDVYGLVDGMMNGKANHPDQVKSHLDQQNLIDTVNKFIGKVDEEARRYELNGTRKTNPKNIGKQLARHRRKRDFAETKNSDPENSSFTSGRKVNIDRLEKQGELNDSVHYDVREEQDEVKLILNGEVKDLHSDRIELSSSRYQDLTLDELGGEYGEPFGEEIASLERGEIESDGSENLSNISTVIYDDIVAE